MVLEVLATAIRQEEIKGIQIGKEEEKLIICRKHESYVENPTGPAKNLFNLINEFIKGARYKVNIEKLMALLYTNDGLSEREIMRKSHSL